MLEVLEQGWERVLELPSDPSANEVRQYLRQVATVRRELDCEKMVVRICRSTIVRVGELGPHGQDIKIATDGEIIEAVLQSEIRKEQLPDNVVIIRCTIYNKLPNDGEATRFSFEHLSMGVIPRVQGYVQTRGDGIDVTLPRYMSETTAKPSLSVPTTHKIPGFPDEWHRYVRASVQATVFRHLRRQALSEVLAADQDAAASS